jgi:hypothetical protein
VRTRISQTTEFTEHRKNWKEHIHRMSSDRIPKSILKFQPKEQQKGLGDF